MQSLESRIETLDNKLDELNNNVLRLQGQMMPRAEIEAADGRRVSLERFEGESASVRDRLTRLESGPQKMLAWLAMGAGCFSVIVTAAGVLVAIAVAIIPHLR